MGDIVGVHEPHVKHVEQLIKRALLREGINLTSANPGLIQTFATSIAGLNHKPIEEQEFRRLIREDERVKYAWDCFLIACG